MEKQKRQRKPRQLTPEGARRQAATQYKPGHAAPAAYTPQVYESMIAAYAAEFPGYFFPTKSPEEAQERLEDPQTFRALLLYIFKNVFQAGPGSTNSNLDYNDTGLLYFIFQQYLLLCARYTQIPNVGNYCMLTGIDQNTFNCWMNGTSRRNTATNKYNYNNTIFYSVDSNNIYSDNDNIVNVLDNERNNNSGNNSGSNIMNHQDLTKKILDICRTALEDQTGRKNSVGSMFLLKAVHGYRDSAPIQLEVSQAAPRESAQAIAARYADQERPQLPGSGDNLTDNS